MTYFRSNKSCGGMDSPLCCAREREREKTQAKSAFRTKKKKRKQPLWRLAHFIDAKGQVVVSRLSKIILFNERWAYYPKAMTAKRRARGAVETRGTEDSVSEIDAPESSERWAPKKKGDGEGGFGLGFGDRRYARAKRNETNVRLGAIASRDPKRNTTKKKIIKRNKSSRE